MPPVPSLKSAFSALMGSAPSLSTTPMGMSQSTPATTKPGAFAPTPAVPVIKPAAPNTANSQSSSTALSAGQFNGLPPVPSLSGGKTTATTPISSAPAVPSLPTQQTSQNYSPYVTTPSGATVDPNTGALIKAPTGTLVSANPDLSGATSGVSADNTGNTGGTQNYSGSAGGVAGYTGITSTNPLFTSQADEDAYKKYQSSLSYSPEELDAMQKLGLLNASAATAYSNVQNQAIPLEFITGQQAALQRSQSALSAPLEAQLSLAQAKRQMAMTASKASLDREDAKLSALRDLAKPVSTAYGGTTSRFNPSTGQYETVVNPFGTATGTGNGTDQTGGATDVIGQAIADGRLTADMVTRYGIPFLASTLQKDPGYNFVTQKASVTAGTTSLTDATKYATTVQRSFNTANDNLKNIISYMNTAGINTASNIPVINDLQNKLKAGVTDAGTIAGFQSALSGLRAEYAQVLARGGEVTDNARNSAASLIPDNISPTQLQQVADRLNAEGTNAIKEANDTVTKLKTNIGGNAGSSGTNMGTSGSKGGSSADPLGIL